MNRLPFYTLSYIWGTSFHDDILNLYAPPSAEDKTVMIDRDSDREVPVTENLLTVMTHLIRNEGGPLMLFWINALSINRKNDAEKASQISMMGDIYAASLQTVVWLGTEDPTPRFLWMHASKELEIYLTDVADGRQDRVPTPAVLNQLGIVSHQDWQDTMWEYVTFYRRRRYFRRVWIIQETSLAQYLSVI